MAVQSLYRRYRPRRFSEVKGQEHVVQALRNAVINHREGQAYLFSGPRGTGKTTSARILAKVLNCTNPSDGEPCCECESCLSVERGNSYDVHELDAASNNGVDAMRDLIEKSSLGTPGRHKVYILDEVHMLSKAAEAALLKTLEEPPPHVVFVLATTDPQKVSETIRSRTQHLQFHLLPMDVMESHIKWLAAEAGIEIDDAGLLAVLRQGGGSARDTVSALELVASGGGASFDTVPLDEFIEAFIEHDPGRALTVVAFAVQQGRDPRTLADDIVRHLRDCFLSLMAPELVQLPAQRAEEVSRLAQRLGAASLVRAIERVGETLVEMRHAPDTRLLLEVALVQLTHDASSVDIPTLLDRIERLEAHVVAGAATPPARPAPVDPATGRAQLGGRARPASTAPPSAPVSAAPESAIPETTILGASIPEASSTSIATPAQEPSATVAPASAPVGSSVAGDPAARAAAIWTSQITTGLKGLSRAMFAATKLVGVRDGAVVIAAPNDTHRQKCQQAIKDLEALVLAAVGAKVPIVVVVDGAVALEDLPLSEQVAVRAPAPPAAVEDETIDVSELVDVPPESIQTTDDKLLQAFPGSSFADE